MAGDRGQVQRSGGTGYGDLKKLLLGRLLDTFRAARTARAALERDPGHVESVLRDGRERAAAAMADVMRDCRRVCGLGSA